eukprot:CAMPEP_0181309870 /NCGR_PEP_ID=MMETSP1101-20121128/12256_1 /TAXON_ID=46948 /ORGANISM="Rhodomonas abbreviata, Strain Caron Lab Isolate" /LENGTH=147 /DNA_ID=CAMNT_0023416407 /DNA_START=246 /DNA_END=686 /DNA_ORIENTATION=+
MPKRRTDAGVQVALTNSSVTKTCLFALETSKFSAGREGAGGGEKEDQGSEVGDWMKVAGEEGKQMEEGCLMGKVLGRAGKIPNGGMCDRMEGWDEVKGGCGEISKLLVGFLQFQCFQADPHVPLMGRTHQIADKLRHGLVWSSLKIF